ncbi:MAG: type II CAAX prenyl endopeptidase Rce1 family protein [Thermoplasmatota archaeon]
MNKKPDFRRVAVFLLFAFAISWTIGFLLDIFQIGIDTLYGSILVLLFMWGPAISGFLVLLFWTEESFLSQFKKYLGFSSDKFNKKWTLLAWLTPLPILFIMLGVGLLLPGIGFSGGMQEFFMLIIQMLIAGLTINALAAFGEEFGWRAILLDEVSPLGFWKASIMIGIIWGVWHAPLILWGYYFPGDTALGLLVMLIFTITFAHVFTYFTARSKNVIASSLLHGSFNSLGPLAFIFLTGAGELVIGTDGLIGIIAVFIFLVLGCLVHDRFIAEESITTKKSLKIWS